MHRNEEQTNFIFFRFPATIKASSRMPLYRYVRRYKTYIMIVNYTTLAKIINVYYVSLAINSWGKMPMKRMKCIIHRSSLLQIVLQRLRDICGYFDSRQLNLSNKLLIIVVLSTPWCSNYVFRYLLIFHR